STSCGSILRRNARRSEMRKKPTASVPAGAASGPGPGAYGPGCPGWALRCAHAGSGWTPAAHGACGGCQPPAGFPCCCGGCCGCCCQPPAGFPCCGGCGGCQPGAAAGACGSGPYACGGPPGWDGRGELEAGCAGVPGVCG